MKQRIKALVAALGQTRVITTLRQFDFSDLVFLVSAAVAVWGVWEIHPPTAKICAGLIGALVALRSG